MDTKSVDAWVLVAFPRHHLAGSKPAPDIPRQPLLYRLSTAARPFNLPRDTVWSLRRDSPVISSDPPSVTRVTCFVTPVTLRSAQRDDGKEMNVCDNGGKVGYGFRSAEDGSERESRPGVAARSQVGHCFFTDPGHAAPSGHLRPPVLERPRGGPPHLDLRLLRRGAQVRGRARLGGYGRSDRSLVGLALGSANGWAPQDTRPRLLRRRRLRFLPDDQRDLVVASLLDSRGRRRLLVRLRTRRYVLATVTLPLAFAGGYVYLSQEARFPGSFFLAGTMVPVAAFVVGICKAVVDAQKSRRQARALLVRAGARQRGAQAPVGEGQGTRDLRRARPHREGGPRLGGPPPDRHKPAAAERGKVRPEESREGQGEGEGGEGIHALRARGGEALGEGPQASCARRAKRRRCPGCAGALLRWGRSRGVLRARRRGGGYCPRRQAWCSTAPRRKD